eukprot:5473995-Prymnesium_polylepis.2
MATTCDRVTPTKRERDEPWRVRKPLSENFPPGLGIDSLESVVRVETPQQRNAAATQPKKPKKSQAHVARTGAYDPLEVSGQCAERSKEQIDALEKMLHSAMPPRVVLDNSFAGLRNAVADEIELGMETQWRKGVQHGEWLAAHKILELEAEVNRLRGSYRDLQQDYTKVMGETKLDWTLPPPPPLPDTVWEPPKELLEPLVMEDDDTIDSDLATELARWLESTPRDPDPFWLNAPDSQPPSPASDEIDLDAMTREISSIQNLLVCEA